MRLLLFGLCIGCRSFRKCLPAPLWSPSWPAAWISAPLCGLQRSTYSGICSTFSTSFSDLYVHHSSLNSFPSSSAWVGFFPFLKYIHRAATTSTGLLWQVCYRTHWKWLEFSVSGRNSPNLFLQRPSLRPGTTSTLATSTKAPLAVWLTEGFFFSLATKQNISDVFIEIQHVWF